jgi:hypothetical protein
MGNLRSGKSKKGRSLDGRITELGSKPKMAGKGEARLEELPKIQAPSSRTGLKR